MPYIIDGHNLIGALPDLALDDPDDRQNWCKNCAVSRRARGRLHRHFRSRRAGRGVRRCPTGRFRLCSPPCAPAPTGCCASASKTARAARLDGGHLRRRSAGLRPSPAPADPEQCAILPRCWSGPSQSHATLARTPMRKARLRKLKNGWRSSLPEAAATEASFRMSGTTWIRTRNRSVMSRLLCP